MAEVSGVARMAVSQEVPVTRAQAAAALGARRDAWLGEPTADGRWLLDLELPVGPSLPHARFRKAAYLQVGALRRAARQPLSVEITWQAAGLAPLFPVFAGTLAWDAGELRLVGVYAPPGGRVGLLADRLALNAAARGTGRWLLGRVAEAMRAA